MDVEELLRWIRQVAKTDRVVAVAMLVKAAKIQGSAMSAREAAKLLEENK